MQCERRVALLTCFSILSNSIMMESITVAARCVSCGLVYERQRQISANTSLTKMGSEHELMALDTRRHW